MTVPDSRPDYSAYNVRGDVADAVHTVTSYINCPT